MPRVVFRFERLIMVSLLSRLLLKSYQDKNEARLTGLQRGHGLADDSALRAPLIYHSHGMAGTIRCREQVARRNGRRARIAPAPNAPRQSDVVVSIGEAI